jgi:dTDP-glucose pyrophosphorylase
MRSPLIANHLLINSASVREALEKINEFSTGQPLVLFLHDEVGRLTGSLTDGDIRRALLAGVGLGDRVELAANRNFHSLLEGSPVDRIKFLRESDLKIIPIVDSGQRVKDLINFKETRTMLPVDVVIMAGGKGTRLHPYTKDLPKPMLELDGKPIIAHNMDRLASYGVKNFHISVNHMKEQIVEFLRSRYTEGNIKIHFIEEESPLGTIGSVSLSHSYSHSELMVMNADILTNIDFEDFYLFFKESKSTMSIAAFDVRVDVPYAVLETEQNLIKSFVEKPSYLFRSNAGIYLLSQEAVSRIPRAMRFDAIDLMNDLIGGGKNVSYFPIRGYWLDIGNPQNYKKALEDIRHIRF